MPTNPTNKHESPHGGDRRMEARAAGARGFTLIEMLIVVSVIAILAALIFPVMRGVNKAKIRNKLQTEKQQIITAIETYKAKKGHYPPDNPTPPSSATPCPWSVNQLYYELSGTHLTRVNNNNEYVTLDGKNRLPESMLNQAFGGKVGGFENCALSTNNQEEVASVVKCLRLLRDNQVDTNEQAGIMALVGSVPLPRDLLTPPGYPGATKGGYCSWRYNSSNPTNNPGSFDLWIDVILDGKTNRISNWKRDAEIVNSP